ncbi:MAG: hypothetical protein ABIH46_02480 [Chloroflexota bacterium]
MSDPNCPLCTRKLQEANGLPYLHPPDGICWASYCVSHPGRVIVVLERHSATATPEEWARMESIIRRLRPGCTFKTSLDSASIPHHFHLHET